MQTYRIYASMIDYVYLDVEANSLEEARDIAYDADGSEYKRQGMGDWHLDSIELKEGNKL
jgi:hypothetical protein